MREEGIQLRVMGATLASVALHAGVAWVLAESTLGGRLQGAVGQADTSLVIPLAPARLAEPEPPKPPVPKTEPEKAVQAPPPPVQGIKEPPEVTPGIDNSAAQTKAWVGFAEATEQRARRSEVEQSAMSPQPGLPGETQASAPPPQAKPEQGPPAPAEPEVTTPDPAEQQSPSGGGGGGGGASGQGPPEPPSRPAEAKPERSEEAPEEVARPAKQALTPGPDGTPEAVKGQENGGVEAAPLEEAAPAEASADAGVKGGMQAKAGAKEASAAARPEAKDEAGQTPSTPEAKGEVADEAKDEVKGSSERDELGVLPEAVPAQRRAEARSAKREVPLGDELAEQMGPPVPEWLRRAAMGVSTPSAGGAAQGGANANNTNAPTSAAPASPAPLPAAGTPASGDTPGIKSDSESTAASTFEVTSLQFGKVLARQGLKIRTVRPRFAITTLLTTSPRDATVEITFGRDGSVIRAQFSPGETTGSRDIDDVLVRSAYRWEATGQDLARIPAGKPDAGVTVKIRFILK